MEPSGRHLHSHVRLVSADHVKTLEDLYPLPLHIFLLWGIYLELPL